MKPTINNPDKTVANRLRALLYGRWIGGSLIFFAALAWGATFLQLARGAKEFPPLVQIGIFGVGVICLILIPTPSSIDRLRFGLKWAASTPKLQAILIILLGVSLRIAWVITFPSAPSSDGATYISLARRLLAGTGYEASGTFAFWPPGYPFFLVAWLFAMPEAVAIPMSQITLFIVGALGIFRLTKYIGGQPAASIATLLFAVWPNLVAMCSTPEKEALILALLPWTIFWALRGKKADGLLAGIALGASILVQPSLQLMIPGLAFMLIVRGGLKSLPLSLLVVAGSLLVIAPWTIRNIQVLGEFKLVGTNGGDVLYRANNPLATGGYTERGEIDLSQMSELESDKKGKELAIRWISENPVSFIILALEKQVRYMGDDAVGIYSTFRANGNARKDALYIPLKLFANAWWLFIWLVLAKLVMKGNSLPKDARFTFIGWCYLFALHSVFESAGKYHVPMIWILCITFGTLLTHDTDADRQETSH